MDVNSIIFLCGARDFHAMDWYFSAKKFMPSGAVSVATDLMSAEGMKCLVDDSDVVHKLFIIDRLLFKRQTNLGNKWRNLLKYLVIPIQILKIKRLYRKNQHSVFYAHGMYYMFLAHKAKVPYIGTPQGSELLIRPFKSHFYFNFAKFALQGAKIVTVDSVAMQQKAVLISEVKPYIIQNGIDVKNILKYSKLDANQNRNIFLSIRGFTPLYREIELLKARNLSKGYNNIGITFISPFVEEDYLTKGKENMNKKDSFLGRLNREDMYKLLAKSKIVFSIPQSDSSPRSVYESIFMGAIVIITPNNYYDILPADMQERIVIADIDEPNWFDKAVDRALIKTGEIFVPSQESISMFDQEESLKKILSILKK